MFPGLPAPIPKVLVASAAFHLSRGPETGMRGSVLMNLPSLLPACLALCLLAGPAAAQQGKPSPFEATLRDAMDEYRAGEIDEAAAALDKARAILDKAKSDRVHDALPDAPDGWTADEMTTEDVPAQ